jgi:hypothetical protein
MKPTKAELELLKDDAQAANMSELAYWQHRNTESFRGASVSGFRAILARIAEKAPQSLVQSTVMLLSQKIESLRQDSASKALLTQVTSLLSSKLQEVKDAKLDKSLYIQNLNMLLSKFEDFIPKATLTSAVNILAQKIESKVPSVSQDPSDTQIKVWARDFKWTAATFGDADVSLPTDVITPTYLNMPSLTKGQFTTTGVLPTGLALATDYWLVKQEANRFSVATSLENATAETPVFVDITAASGGGVHTFTPEVLEKHELCLRCGDGTIRRITLA